MNSTSAVRVLSFSSESSIADEDGKSQKTFETKTPLPSGNDLKKWVADAAHLLPEQAPLHAFVHHNTLHAFEHLPFEDAVVEASKVLGTEPFQQEADFALHFSKGRISAKDIEEVLKDHALYSSPPGFRQDARLFLSGPTRFEFRMSRLQHLFKIPKATALSFVLEETDAKRSFHPDVSAKRKAELERAAAEFGAVTADTRDHFGDEAHLLDALWKSLSNATPPQETSSPKSIRRRGALLRTTGMDTDESIQPLLIRLTAAFLDQGVAYWTMPERELGFLSAVRSLYSQARAPSRALKGLREMLLSQEKECWSAEKTIFWALQEQEIPYEKWPKIVEETLLSLRGWAGMMHHLEHRPDRAPVRTPGATLMDFLALHLVFDTCAVKNLVIRRYGESCSFKDLEQDDEYAASVNEAKRIQSENMEIVYEAYVFAQYASVDVKSLLKPANATVWLKEVSAFGEIQRRTLLHLAYERRHRVEVLDGLSAHCQIPLEMPPQPAFQAAFCIDDREESLRRHLEECFPAVETFGYAGFYGVAMNYQGAEDIRPRPLCPVNIRPKHFILEEIIETSEEVQYRSRRHRQALASSAMNVGSTTLVRGGVLSFIFGMVALVPLVLRSVFPRIATAFSHSLDHRVAPKPRTRLRLERDGSRDAARSSDDSLPGYTVEEMVPIVENVLKTMGLVQDLCPLVLIVGHGSSSLNNPHEAAHDCGATGGGHGGSNARAFAMMANHPDVRNQLRERGISVGDEVFFIGAFHNTCDDAMTYYDEDLLPESHRSAFQSLRGAMRDACVLDAHERCRRFETAPADLPENRAMAFAETHASDLAEPRPEYGHASNAICVVGRRERTRGLFLDRRAFLVSYDPSTDPEGDLLASLLLSVGPVGAGINLEYYFSFVDPDGYGSGTKLPHNITGLIGVMDGHSTDLRTGLPWQMVEIHEPVRLLTIVEAKTDVLEKILAREPGLAQLIQNGWIQFVAWDPDSEKMSVFQANMFREYQPESTSIQTVKCSAEHYAGKRDHLPLAHVQQGLSKGIPNISRRSCLEEVQHG